ncbi:hypothetical protein NRS6085_10720 [Bacillus subtilis]|nr:hypothetical protein NRS6085_01114 [Bacillus subtilis]CAI6271061.1 hypothetical protein NRS6085_10720 [Bacillus subtilis]
MIRLDRLINPTKHSFYFRLSKFDCYKVRTGKCSLDLNDKEFNALEGEEREYALKCRRLAAHYIQRRLCMPYMSGQKQKINS